MYVCVCAAVTDSQIRQKIGEGASFKDLREELRIARQCCKCAKTVHQMFNKYEDEPLPAD